MLPSQTANLLLKKSSSLQQARTLSSLSQTSGQRRIRGRSSQSLPTGKSMQQGKRRTYATATVDIPPELRQAADRSPAPTASPRSHPVEQRADNADDQTKSALRALLREVAQPVAVVTSFMPENYHQHHPPRTHSRLPRLHSHPLPHDDPFHGATLSSLSSIAMDPHPLVSFALRVPSRMATTLSALVPTTLTPPDRPSRPGTIPEQVSSPLASQKRVSSVSHNAHLVLNILSQSQHSLAQAFSRPDLHPHPFKEAAYTLNVDGLPVLDSCLGALACRVVGRVKLSELGDQEDVGDADRLGRRDHSGGVVSELFIARVMRVERIGVNQGASLENENIGEALKPLLYWRRAYTGCEDN